MEFKISYQSTKLHCCHWQKSHKNMASTHQTSLITNVMTNKTQVKVRIGQNNSLTCQETSLSFELWVMIFKMIKLNKTCAGTVKPPGTILLSHTRTYLNILLTICEEWIETTHCDRDMHEPLSHKEERYKKLTLAGMTEALKTEL